MAQVTVSGDNLHAFEAVIINALNLGKTVEEIADFTGILLEEIMKVKTSWINEV